MKKTIKNIVTNADIQNINTFIKDWQNTPPTDPEMALLREVIMDIKNYDIPLQFAVYTLLQNQMNVANAARQLNVTKPALYTYLRRWKRNVIDKFSTQYDEYDRWLEKVNDENNTILYYKLFIPTNETE